VDGEVFPLHCAHSSTVAERCPSVCRTVAGNVPPVMIADMTDNDLSPEQLEQLARSVVMSGVLGGP
jgi:hypothetical protein